MKRTKKAKKTEIQNEKLLTVSELSNVVGLSESFLKKAKAEYELPHYKIGSMLRFRLDEVLTWIERRKIAG